MVVPIQDEGRDPEADMGDADPEEDRGDESCDDMCINPPPPCLFGM